MNPFARSTDSQPTSQPAQGEVSRDEFIAHVAQLYEGKSEVPATYTYPTDVEIISIGQLISREAFETFTAAGRNPFGMVVHITSIGSQTNDFQQYKENTLRQLKQFFDKQPNIKFFIGSAYSQKMSLWASAPNAYDAER